MKTTNESKRGSGNDERKRKKISNYIREFFEYLLLLLISVNYFISEKKNYLEL